MNPVADIIQKIVSIQQRIDKILDLDKKGLLERRELHEFKIKITEEIRGFIHEADDETQRHFKKITSGWTNMPKPGFTSPGDAEKDLKDIIEFINQSVQRLTGKHFKTEVYIAAGRPFDGRAHLQNILNAAQKEIFIVDNYLQRSILSVLSSVVENKSNFTLKFLIGDKNKGKFDGFTADLVDFAKQYPLTKIECKLNNSLHDRFIIIDDSQLYTVGSSLDAIGEKGNFINLIDDQNSKNAHMNDMLNLWNSGSTIY